MYPQNARPIINRLNQEIARILNQLEMKARLLDLGSEVIGGSPEQIGAAMK